MSDDLLREMAIYVETMLAVGRPENHITWDYIVVVAGQLEYLAVAILWVHDEKREPLWEFEDRTTLKQAPGKLEQHQLVGAGTIEALQRIGDLRNKVVHRRLVQGVTLTAKYGGGNVFEDANVLQAFVDDATSATNDLAAWLKRHGDDQFASR